MKAELVNSATKMQKVHQKYSIVIPTRNRVEYLPYAINSVLASKRQDIELIVSNNHSTDGTAEFLSTLSDPRIKIVMPEDELPMSRHYEFAISHASGEWITIVGDDDAVMPYLFEKLDYLTRKYPDISIISSARAYYFWSGCEDLYGPQVVAYAPGSREQIRSARRDLLVSLGGLKACFDMPQLYSGCIVRTDLVRRIAGRCGGQFYFSIIPDMYSVIALTFFEDTYLRIDDPLFWTGTSNKSMSRSDRIYRDSTVGMSPEAEGKKQPTLALNSGVSQVLHQFGFGPYYLYEALMQSPLAPAAWKGKLIGAIVLGALLAESRETAKSRQIQYEELRGHIVAQVRKNGLTMSAVMLIAGMLRFLAWGRKEGRRVRQTYRRLRGWECQDCVYSNRREEFPTILDASRAVEKIRLKFPH